MTLRTPRRRISPRTKLKYRAIKNFFRRALGTSPQGYINNTNSSIEESVTEIKSKIDILEQQLDRVSKHCQNLETLEQTLSKETDNLTQQLSKAQEELLATVRNTKKSNRNLKKIETQLLYQHPNREFRNRDKIDNIVNVTKHEEKRSMASFEPTYKKNINKILYTPNSNKHKKLHDRNEIIYEQPKNIKFKYNTIGPINKISSFQSLAAKECKSPNFSSYRRKNSFVGDPRDCTRDIRGHNKKYQRHESSRKKNNYYRDIDEEFIADIIKRQYKPVKLFGKRHSDFSQFSAPVCHDQEYRIQNKIQESGVCSCCYNEDRMKKHRYIRSSDLSDMRSICDTRLYSSKKHRSHHGGYIDKYNNATLYDVVPVKEKSSPNSRKKFIENNLINYHCKEVPPSPKTHRPRLNLKVHNYTPFEDGRENGSQNIVSRICENNEHRFNRYESDLSVGSAKSRRANNNSITLKNHKSAQIQEVSTASSLRSRYFNNNNHNIFKDATLNTHVTDSTIDKTDKTLGEIKDILQSFLLEIKSAHDDKSNKIEDKKSDGHQQDNTKKIFNSMPNSFNYNIAQCSAPSPYLPTFPNSCCYPVIPMSMCPVNYLHNGYVIPSPSFTYTASAKHSKGNTCFEKDCCDNKSETSQELKSNNETQKLIKEIHKFVSQNPKSVHNANESFQENSTKNEQHVGKILTNRSAGSSNKVFKHDANVGTPNMKCHSKSCEAFGSRIPSDTHPTTNTSCVRCTNSDTLIDKLSLEASQSTTESDVSSETPVQGKRSKFKRVLKSLKLFKKKKDITEDMTKSTSSAEVKTTHKPPFRQHITTYTMHGQEFCHAPPIPKQHFCPPHQLVHSYNYGQGNSYQRHLSHNEACEQHYCGPVNIPHCNPTRLSPGEFCPNYDPCYNQIPTPQVPLCLKEIEVKSIGTQSVRKMSIFRKFTKKMQPGPQQDASQQYSSPVTPNKPTLWKSLQEKAYNNQNTDPLTFSLKTQNQLAQGDIKLRNVMLKKLFYKRNPFSPRNLIVRTLLGKDKSSYGNPPKMYRPRMFL